MKRKFNQKRSNTSNKIESDFIRITQSEIARYRKDQADEKDIKTEVKSETGKRRDKRN